MATGGSQSVIWVLKNKVWQKIETPAKANDGCGIFSLAVQKNKMWIAGGCWQKPNDTEGNFYFSTNAGKNWEKSLTPPQGYRSCIDCDQICVTTGSNGTEISHDYGKNWKKIDEGFHTCRIYKNKIWLAGSKGRVKVFVF